MPYIKQEDREVFDDHLYELGEMIEKPGEMNYCFTVLIKHYLKNLGKTYQSINDCIGVLEAAKLEFYRRDVVEYENLKKDINGDIKI